MKDKARGVFSDLENTPLKLFAKIILNRAMQALFLVGILHHSFSEFISDKPHTYAVVPAGAVPTVPAPGGGRVFPYLSAQR